MKRKTQQKNGGKRDACATGKVKLPPHLMRLGEESTRPRFIGRAVVAELMEFWGFADDGAGHVKKLVSAGVLVTRKFSHQKHLRYCVASVMAYYAREMRLDPEGARGL